MGREPSPQDFTGDLEQEETKASGIKARLNRGFVTAKGAAKSAYTRPRDAVYRVTKTKDPETGEINESRRNVIRTAAGLTGLIGAGAVADKYSDGELDGNFRKESQTPPPAGGGNNQTETETPEHTTEETYTPEEPTETSTETRTETETETPTTTERPYSGEIDGRGYELHEIPGPVEGRGYIVNDDILEQYDPDGWADIIDEEEYEALGTGTDWYLKQDAIIGINTEKRVSRTFPGEEFNYDTDELYEDIREEAQQEGS